jgi:hypothetical protein
MSAIVDDPVVSVARGAVLDSMRSSSSNLRSAILDAAA